MAAPKKIEGTNLDRPENVIESMKTGEVLSLGNVVPNAYKDVYVGEFVKYWASSATEMTIEDEGQPLLKVDLIRFNDILMEL